MRLETLTLSTRDLPRARSFYSIKLGFTIVEDRDGECFVVDAGGVTLGETRLAAGEHDVAVERADGELLKVGRRRFRRLRAR